MTESARRALLLLVTAGMATGEAAALKSVGFVSAMGLAPQITAPPPFALFHDMRWLFVYNRSWATFAAEAAGLVAAQSLLNTATVVLAWPAGRDRPRLRSVAAGNAIFAVVALVILSPWACVSFAASGTSLSWFVLGEVGEFFVLAVVLQRGGIVSRWWLGLPPLRAAGATLATFATLTVGSLLINLTPGWWAVPVAGAAGAANGVLWRALILAVLSADGSARRAGTGRIRSAAGLTAGIMRLPALAVPAALAVTLGGLFVLGHDSAAGYDRGMPAPLLSQGSHGAQSVVLFVNGYNSKYSGAAPIVTSPGLVYEVYSYRGLNSRGLPRPYDAQDTQQSLARSAHLLAAQVQRLHERTGRPVAIVAESEGTLVARTYLMTMPHPHVAALALFSPLIRPARVYYPPAGASSGFGYVTGLELAGIITLLRDTGSPPMSTAEPFVRSTIGNAPRYRNDMLCPTPGVRSIAFLSLAAAAVAPPGPMSDIPVVEIPGVHASLEDDGQARALLLSFLRGGAVPPHTMLGFGLLRDAAAAWQAPALPLALNPHWDYPAGAPDASFGGPVCTTVPRAGSTRSRSGGPAK